jgi:hypothetical protein
LQLAIVGLAQGNNNKKTRTWSTSVSASSVVEARIRFGARFSDRPAALSSRGSATTWDQCYDNYFQQFFDDSWQNIGAFL